MPNLRNDRRRVEVDDGHAGAPVDARHLEQLDARRPRDVGDALRAAEPLRVDERQAHDLAEAEGHDGEVVTTHPQRRGAEEDARDHRDDDRDRHAPQPRQRAVLGAEDTDGVGAHGVEADVAEVEQAGIPDDDVEAQGHEDVGRDREEHPAEVGVRRRDERDVEQRQGEEEDGEEDPEHDLERQRHVARCAR